MLGVQWARFPDWAKKDSLPTSVGNKTTHFSFCWERNDSLLTSVGNETTHCSLQLGNKITIYNDSLTVIIMGTKNDSLPTPSQLGTKWLTDYACWKQNNSLPPPAGERERERDRERERGGGGILKKDWRVTVSWEGKKAHCPRLLGTPWKKIKYRMWWRALA